MHVLRAPGSGAPWRSGSFRALAVLVFAALAVLIASPPAGATFAPLSGPQQAARAWYQQVIVDLTPLDTSLVSGLQTAGQWQDGKETANVANLAIAQDLPDLQLALHNLEGQTPLAGHAESLADITAGVNLYLQAFKLEYAATALPSGRLTSQLQRSFLRVRQLGDVTYDQGVAQVAALLGSTLAGPDVRAAQRIPDWPSLHLTPGPPLASSWIGTTKEPSGVQSVSAWTAALARLRAPSQARVRTMIGPGSTVKALYGLALSLQRADVSLASVAGPSGHATASPALRIGLLVDAEAALAAEASRVATPAPGLALQAVAASLATIGGGLRAAATTGAAGGTQ